MFRSMSIGFALLLLPFQGVLGAEPEVTDFSADMLQTDDHGQRISGKMYSSQGRVRTEMEQGGQRVIQIVDPERGVAWVLNPRKKEYMEQKGSVPGPIGSGGGNPCAGMQGMKCRKLGEESVQDRKAEKWEMVAESQGQTFRSVQWIDVERGIPLRQEMPGGQVTELRLVGEETVNGRKTEKWEMLSRFGKDKPVRSYQWYDATLGLAIREEFPGDQVRELKNIVAGAQASELFQVPKNYKKISVPGRQ